MKYSLLFACSQLIIACSQQPKPVFPEKSKLPKQADGVPSVDPYFAESTDTVSTHGPKNITRNILQDSRGNYWFASWAGIIQYDGEIFTNHTLKDNLKHFHVFSLLEDKAGNIWFGTIRGGLYKYDGKKFTYFTKADGLADNMIECMIQDQKGDIWFGTNNGLSCYDGSTFTNYYTKDGLSSNTIHSLAQDKKGRIWVGTQDGVSYYDQTPAYKVEKQKLFTAFEKQKGVPFINVRSVIEDKDGNIWIGSQEGLCCYDGKENKEILTNFTGYIFEDKSGNIWLSLGNTGNVTINTGQSPINLNLSGMALYRFKFSNKTVLKESDFTKIAEKSTRDDTQVFGITQDKEGNIWFGTMQGVCIYNSNKLTTFKR